MTDKEIEAHSQRVVADTASDMADTMSYAMARAIKKTFCKHDWHFTNDNTMAMRCVRCGTQTPELNVNQMTGGYKFHEPHPNSIRFYNGAPDNTEVLRISKDGIWANADVPTDEASQAVLRAVDGYIKQMVDRVRSEYTTVAWGVFEDGNLHDMFFLEVEAKEMARLKGEHALVRPMLVWGRP